MIWPGFDGECDLGGPTTAASGKNSYDIRDKFAAILPQLLIMMCFSAFRNLINEFQYLFLCICRIKYVLFACF